MISKKTAACQFKTSCTFFEVLLINYSYKEIQPGSRFNKKWMIRMQRILLYSTLQSIYRGTHEYTNNLRLEYICGMHMYLYNHTSLWSCRNSSYGHCVYMTVSFRRDINNDRACANIDPIDHSYEYYHDIYYHCRVIVMITQQRMTEHYFELTTTLLKTG